MSWDKCAIGHPGLMTLESGSTTVPVAALVFHEYFSTRSCLRPLDTRDPCAYPFPTSHRNLILTGLH